MRLVSRYSEATEVLRNPHFGRQGFIRLLNKQDANIDSGHLAATMLFRIRQITRGRGDWLQVYSHPDS